jgi:hypothetical protein
MGMPQIKEKYIHLVPNINEQDQLRQIRQQPFWDSYKLTYYFNV